MDTKICYVAALPFHEAMAAVSPRGKQWQVGDTIDIAFIGGTSKQRSDVKKYASEWLESKEYPVNLKFNFGVAIQESDVRISFKKGMGSWSYLGTDALFVAKTQPTMNFGWDDPGTIRHEFGHMLSLSHEHQHPEAEINWDQAKVIRYFSGPPNNWNLRKIKHNILKRLAPNSVRANDYDDDSVMLYFFPDHLTTDGKGTEQNHQISDGDLELVSEMYPFKNKKAA